MNNYQLMKDMLGFLFEIRGYGFLWEPEFEDRFYSAIDKEIFVLFRRIENGKRTTDYLWATKKNLDELIVGKYPLDKEITGPRIY